MDEGFRGYIYSICEISPYETPQLDVIKHTGISRDNLEDAMKILKVLEDTDINFTVYRVMLEPFHA